MRLYGALVTVWRSAFAVVILVVVCAAVEVGGAFVFIWATVVLVFRNEFTHIRRRVLVQLLIAAKDEDGDIDRAEHRKLMSLLEQSAFSLEKGDRTISVILDGLDLNLSPAHFDGMKLEMLRRIEEMKLLGSRKGVAGKPKGRALEIASRLR